MVILDSEKIKGISTTSSIWHTILFSDRDRANFFRAPLFTFYFQSVVRATL